MNRKPLSERQGHRLAGTALEVVKPSTLPAVVPRPPIGLLPLTRERWRTFWTSELAGATVPTDGPAIERYFLALDEYERVGKVFRKTRLLTGSQGQPVLNPLGRYLGSVADELARLEERFGLGGPLTRARIGLTTAQAQLTVSQLLADLDDET